MMVKEKEAQQLQRLLTEVEAILWSLIFRGGFPTEEMAQAAYDSHRAVKKAKGLVAEHLSQATLGV
jgi:hypothetical protein